MIYVLFDDPIRSKLYHDWREYHADTFCPDVKVLGMVEFRNHGRGYHDRKDHIRETAIKMAGIISEAQDVSWSELNEMTWWLEKYARRYGLLKEFRENGVI